MPPKKKLSKKEKARLEAEQAELLRIELEKEKLKKLEEERHRKQIEREQAEKRLKQEIIENKLRRSQLKNSMEFFNQVQSTIDKIKQNIKEQCDWEKYMRCNGLPSGNIPSDLRKYIHMWREDIERRNRCDHNWLLKTNERSLLTQDTSVDDMSRKTLRNQQAKLGEVYARRIEEVLGILDDVDEAIVCKDTAPNAVVDLIRLKSEIRIFLYKYLDEFSYKVLSHVEREMEIERAGISKHIHSSDVFKSFVWALSSDAELHPNSKNLIGEQNLSIDIDFPTIGMEISFPPSVDLQHSALRGLWLTYDHFSDFCPSYYLRNSKQQKINICKQTKKEWKKRKEILQTMIDDTMKEVSMTSHNIISGKGSSLASQSLFDVDKMYTEYEDEQNAIRRKTIGPDSLKMTETDVNLRKYRIIGGVYSVDYLELPEQDKRLNATSFIRTVVYPDELCRKEYYEKFKPPPPPLPGVRRLPEEIEAEMRLIEASLDKLALVTVQLPDSVLWFEPPLACRWESFMEANESESVDNADVKSKLSTPRSLSDPKSTPRESKYLGNNSAKNQESKIRKVKDFDLLNVPKGTDLHGLLKEFVVPRLPDNFNIHDEDHEARCSHRISIFDNIENSSSPRELHPRFEVIKSVELIIEPELAPKNDNNICEEKSTSTNTASTYMFSQLLEDLDLLCEHKIPFVDESHYSTNHSTESSITPSSATTPPSPPAPEKALFLMDPSMLSVMSSYYSGITLNRETDIPAETPVEVDEAESSSDDYGDSQNCDDELLHVQRGFSDAKVADDDYSGNLKSTTALSNGKWSTRDVHDTKFNEDKLSIQFRAGRLGIFGFALNRYSNMPYQAWEVKPDMKNLGSVLFSFTASIVSLDMTITSEGYCVNTFQGGMTDGLNQMIGKTLSLNYLKSILINSAVDIFPDEDAFCYTEGSCEKNYVMEMHLYRCISSLALSHNFGWSRWNLLAGSRTAVLLMRELIENKKVPNHSTLLVTPLKTSIIDCSEVSPNFNAVGIAGMDYYADLHQLAQIYAQPCSLEKQKSMDPVLRENVANILMSIRPLSFC